MSFHLLKCFIDLSGFEVTSKNQEAIVKSFLHTENRFTVESAGSKIVSADYFACPILRVQGFSEG